MQLDLIRSLSKKTDSKILLLVMDGLGGIQREPGEKTELEKANTPNLDKLAADGICGMHVPVAPGITPGSGPSHLALFGYDPVEYQVGRGVLSALGIDFDLSENDIAARGNFCTIDEKGKITDRRAGRLPTEKNRKLCSLLKEIKLENAEVFIEPVKEYRFLLVLRGNDLDPRINDTDPQTTGAEPLEAKPTVRDARATAEIINRFINQAKEVLSGHHPANMILLRGFSSKPDWPGFGEVFRLKAGSIAAYPMYKGVTKLLGMDILDTGERLKDEMKTLKKHLNDYDFFYFHVKKIDSAGEDGDFDRKVKLIKEVDKIIPEISDLNFDVIVITGDHSTPSHMKFHSWHPVPVLIWSKICRPDSVRKFSETDCLAGGLGNNLPAKNLMTLAMANAGKLDKFGA